jgi:hypothetical protein
VHEAAEHFVFPEGLGRKEGRKVKVRRKEGRKEERKE